MPHGDSRVGLRIAQDKHGADACVIVTRNIASGFLCYCKPRHQRILSISGFLGKDEVQVPRRCALQDSDRIDRLAWLP